MGRAVQQRTKGNKLAGAAPRSKDGGGSEQAGARADGKMFPSQGQVVEAVRSLYADRLEPFGRIILRRIRERHVEAAAGCQVKDGSVAEAPLIDPRALRKICMSCPGLRVRPVADKEISALLVDQQADFVDVCSSADPFSEELWASAAAYFSGLVGEGGHQHESDELMPGGRYACARVLAARKLPFLDGLSLGEVCHFVHLGVSQRRILGYIDGGIVPYERSQASVKEFCAAWQQPLAKQDSPWPVATWEQTRACIACILSAPHSRDSGITISNVKRLFRSHFGLDLSETALGYSRLSELLQDSQLSSVCRVETRGTGHSVVVAAAPLPDEEGCFNDLAGYTWAASGPDHGFSDCWWPSHEWASSALGSACTEAQPSVHEGFEGWDSWAGSQADMSMYGSGHGLTPAPPAPGDYCAGSQDLQDSLRRSLLLGPPPGINGPCMFVPPGAGESLGMGGDEPCTMPLPPGCTSEAPAVFGPPPGLGGLCVNEGAEEVTVAAAPAMVPGSYEEQVSSLVLLGFEGGRDKSQQTKQPDGGAAGAAVLAEPMKVCLSRQRPPVQPPLPDLFVSGAEGQELATRGGGGVLRGFGHARRRSGDRVPRSSSVSTNSGSAQLPESDASGLEEAERRIETAMGGGWW